MSQAVMTCRDCGRSCSGSKACHCMKCHLWFTSESAYARHERVGEPCVDPATFRNRQDELVFELTERAGGEAWSLGGSRYVPST